MNYIKSNLIELGINPYFSIHPMALLMRHANSRKCENTGIPIAFCDCKEYEND